MSHSTRRWALLTALVCLTCGALSSSALASGRKPVWTPRIGNALGLIPPVQDQGKKGYEPSEGGVYAPTTYHGGQTMASGVTVHTIFWAPAGYAFQGSPGAGIPTYQGMISQFFTDVAAASTGTSGATCTLANCNDFTVEPQYGWGTAPGGITSGNYTLSYNNTSTTFPSGYNSADGVILDTDPYPSGGCTSPADAKACLTDAQVQAEVDKIVQASTGTPRGLKNIWYVYTPPDVDECIFDSACETTAFAGYHSLSNVGHGVTIYAYTGDPVVETDSVYSFPHPQGNADGEVAVDISMHEVNEAMTDPEGVGYMDPNGYEVGDKCEFGPQHGTPLGYAANGQPFNQVINGHDYWTQSMWSNADQGCVQATTNTTDPLPLPQVSLHQYSSTISGNTENNTANIHVMVELIRASAAGTPVTVATGSGTTDGTGAWTATLSGNHAVGDDRDEIDVVYSGTGAPSPNHQVILTGNGGNPWTESGWTGFTSMNLGDILTNSDHAPWATPLTSGGPSLTMGPCFQTGVLGYAINGTAGSQSPTDFCSTSADVADTPLSAPVAGGDTVVASSIDNRAYAPGIAPIPNTNGGLVNLTVPVGEPGSTSPLIDPFGIAPSGPPACTADLGAQQLTCIGLVPSAAYSVTDGSQSKPLTADSTGTVSTPLKLASGDVVTLSNGSRTLTTLHVANLRVHIIGDSSTVDHGSCSPNEYWGGPLTSAPTNGFAGAPSALAGGAALTGEICPDTGSAAGLPTSSLGQTDELSGGQTVTEVADIADTSPMEGETMYGNFTALAETTDGTSRVSLTIRHASGGAPVVTRFNVNTPNGSPVSGLKPGTYSATWVVTNPNHDTRLVTTRFIEQPGLSSPPAAQGNRRPAGASPKVACHQVTRTHHGKAIRCNVAFAKGARVSGLVRMRISRGNNVAALGHGRLRNGATTVTMRELRSLHSGTWRITLVYSSGRSQRTVTIRLMVG